MTRKLLFRLWVSLMIGLMLMHWFVLRPDDGENRILLGWVYLFATFPISLAAVLIGRFLDVLFRDAIPAPKFVWDAVIWAIFLGLGLLQWRVILPWVLRRLGHD